MNSKIIMVVVLVIVVGTASFFVGMQYQKGNLAQTSQQTGNFRQRLGQNGNNRPVRGDILSIDDKSMTIKLQDGGSKIVIFSSSTAYMKSATGAISDLKTGSRVMVFGTQNSDGSVTAQNIQINPQTGTMPTGVAK